MSIVLDDEQDHDSALVMRDTSSVGGINPFGTAAPKTTGALATSDTQRAIAEVQAALVIARANLRDERAAVDKILNACRRPGLAEKAMYAYSRGGSEITGPSIRLAEAMAIAWGNMTFGVRELQQRERDSEVEAFAWDLESNVRAVKQFSVSHFRHTRSSTTRLTDPRDIYEKIANEGARRQRACMLAVIPKDVQDAAVAECMKTLKASVKIDKALFDSLLEKFGEFGVTRKQLEAKIQRRLESISPAQVVNLRSIYNSLKDGMSVAADWFEIETAQEVSGGTKADVLKAKLTTAAGTKAVTVDTQTGEVKEAVKAPAKAEPPKVAEVVEEFADPDEDIEQDVDTEEDVIDGESDFVAEDATAADEPVAAPNGIEKSMFYRTLFSVSEEYRLEPASRFRDIILAELKDAHANEITKPIFEEVKKKIIAEARKQKAARK